MYILYCSDFRDEFGCECDELIDEIGDDHFTKCLEMTLEIDGKEIEIVVKCCDDMPIEEVSEDMIIEKIRQGIYRIEQD